MLFFLEYPPRYQQLKSKIQLFVGIAVALLLTCILFLEDWTLTTLLIIDLLILLLLILAAALSSIFVSTDQELIPNQD